MQAAEDKRREGEKVEAGGVEGGPLDQMAEGAVEKARSKGGWMRWGGEDERGLGFVLYYRLGLTLWYNSLLVV